MQLRLEEEIAVRRGDKFVVRFYSPMETIGGGVILEPNPGVKKRFQESVIEELRRKESGSSADVIELHAKKHGDTLITLAELAKLTALSVDEVKEDVKELEEQELYMRPRFSPGYGDFDIQYQEPLMRMLDCAKTIGLTMTDSCMMTPTKSVTALIGASPIKERCPIAGCEACEKKDCEYRR